MLKFSTILLVEGELDLASSRRPRAGLRSEPSRAHTYTLIVGHELLINLGLIHESLAPLSKTLDRGLYANSVCGVTHLLTLSLCLRTLAIIFTVP